MDALELVEIRAQEIAVRIWHPQASRTLIAWHGLARHGGDFDGLARELGPDWRIIAPDTPGRGLSSWSLFPAHDYLYERYMQLALALLDHFRLTHVAWLGTSMGGLLGMMLAASDQGRDRIERLVINDVGPEIETEGLSDLASYFAVPHFFPNFGALLNEVKSHYTGFGIDNEDDWRRLTLNSARRLPDGTWTFHYDPRIAEQFFHDTPRDLWADWRAIHCPLMVIRGEFSPLLSEATVERMQEIHPDMASLTAAGCGHAPMLDRAAQVTPIREFLEHSGDAERRPRQTAGWWQKLRQRLVSTR
ncbi:alpha/beta hydrolase [Halomonas sp. McH1-25]|uniref:alpha/beta fold hydrolase n=1 Tax=unclassified Halomonas TaxID=2609666 RepID=UPI001EF478EE|nr:MULTISPECIES: alpha/beta hydrolase [unclassified Halomonas]MCG7600548.1 alpha/beta hydrolase [Halomonas sp. McH1-25]MCP1342015.1 alpha/beta hydrolase [Halomonas sp. FL8]MCP1361983.1 alpha/beta hydrolase [Halomonas sp. BBD45]